METFLEKLSLERIISYVNGKVPKWLIFGGLVVLECVLTVIIIREIAYTEIDWVAYMQEVKGYLDGERNYLNLRGDTGPLVYPAGFVYIFAWLYRVTDQGKNIFLAQYKFAMLYVFNLVVVLLLYLKGGKVPFVVTCLLVLSKRIHSIFVLRMFNDCVAVFFGYMAILLFCNRNWRWGSLIYSLGVSVKMNMLLYAPGILLVLLMGCGWIETIICLSICAGLQIALGLPFLTTYPIEYISRSFDLGRVFLYKWTVNFKFLPEDVFLSKSLSILLLLSTVAVLAAFAYKWITENRMVLKLARLPFIGVGRLTKGLNPHFIIVTIFASNFIGVAFARTLHYQFYVWYFHTLPYLLWSAKRLPVRLKVLLLVNIELAFNVYPATSWSSAMLQVSHLILLVALYLSPAPLAVQGRGRGEGPESSKDD